MSGEPPAAAMSVFPLHETLTMEVGPHASGALLLGRPFSARIVCILQPIEGTQIIRRSFDDRTCKLGDRCHRPDSKHTYSRKDRH